MAMSEITNRGTVINHWSFVIGESGEKVRRFNMRLKASIPGVQANFHQLHGIRYFDVFAAGSVHLKKLSGGPKGLMGPPCHGVAFIRLMG